MVILYSHCTALVILKYCCTDCTEFEGIFRENAAVLKYLGMISTDNYKHLIKGGPTS